MKHLLLSACLLIVIASCSSKDISNTVTEKTCSDKLDRNPSSLACQSLMDDAITVENLKAPLSEKARAKKIAFIEKQLADSYNSSNINLYQKVKELKEANSEIFKNEKILKATEELIFDESLSTYHELYYDVLNQLTDAPSMKSFSSGLKKKLSSFMSKKEAERRVKLLTKDNLDQDMLMEALGKMTFNQSLEALIGSKGISDISGDNLVNRYLEAAKKSGVEVSTLKGTFKKGPGYKGRGGEKLFISVDRTTAVELEKIIGANPHLLMHKHDSGQGTLYMRYNGKINSYASFGYVEPFNSLRSGAIIPVLPLSTYEANNVNNYFTLGSIEKKFAKYPWGFKESKKADAESYCKIGGFNSCTHWIGEMPIGESKVNKYSMPGQSYDRYSNTNETVDPTMKNQAALRTQKIGSYKYFKGQDETVKVGNVTREDRLARMVWLENAGHEQLWSVVGDTGAKALGKGEWANPGWVLFSFLTRTTQERVPVVFVFRDNAAEPLTLDVLDQMAKEDINPQ